MLVVFLILMTQSGMASQGTLMDQDKCKVAISNYQCELMDKLYHKPKWTKCIAPEKTNHATKGKRVEVLWTNYDPEDFSDSSPLFGEII